MLKDAFDLVKNTTFRYYSRAVTRVCHSKSIVDCYDRKDVPDKPYVKDITKYCPLPAHAKVMQQKLNANIERAKDYSNSCRWNTIEDNGAKFGIIASGISRKYAKEVFGDKANYLNIGFSFHVPD